MTFDVGQLGLAFFGQVLGIILIDIVLSGDNAVVIGMAARSLSPRQRKRAIFFGALGAIVLRIIFTSMAAVLLLVPLLQFIGGIVLVWIAWKLLRPTEGEEANVSEAATMAEAIRIIITADVIMSLDNILAVGAASHGNIALLLFGLFLSIGIIMFCSNIVSVMMNRFPVLVFAGGAILAWVAADMISHDQVMGKAVAAVIDADLYKLVLPWLVTVGVLGAHFAVRARRRPAHLPEPARQEVEAH